MAPKAPPKVAESERATIGMLLRRPEREMIETVQAELQAEDFDHPDCKAAYKAIQHLSDRGLAISTISVRELSGLPHATLEAFEDESLGVSGEQLKTLVKEIKRVSQVRKVFLVCQEACRVTSKNSTVDEIMSTLEKGLLGVTSDSTKEVVDAKDVAAVALESFMERYQSPDLAEVSTGLYALDRAIIGLRKGKMFVLAGRPSMGKTALADTIRRAVVDQGLGAITFSLEMSAEELMERELAFRAKTNLRKILSGKEVTDDEYQRIVGGAGSVLGGLWYVDDASYSIAAIRRRARIVAQRMARAGIKLGLVVLDYIQLAGDNGDGREQSVAAISRGCKLMAKELECTVLALSQLNRSCEGREDRRPLMSDLRESGSIEQDADIVAFVYREHMYNQEADPDEAELIIRKQRSGPLGTVHLHYNSKMVYFEDHKGGSGAAVETGHTGT